MSDAVVEDKTLGGILVAETMEGKTSEDLHMIFGIPHNSGDDFESPMPLTHWKDLLYEIYENRIFVIG